MRQMILLGLAVSMGLAAPMPQVFQITAERCSSEPPRRLQTGFLLDGEQGLITALHGTVGCSVWSARRLDGNVVVTGLQIVKVDVANDVALLNSSGVGQLGIPPLQRGAPPSQGARLRVVGHPQGLLAQHVMELTVENPARFLEELVPPTDVAQVLKTRSSPLMNSRVISLTGDIQPGHSGAPLLDQTGRVVGIGNGGLKGGTVGIGWGIPVSELRLVGAASQGPQLDRLGKLEAALAFEFTTEEMNTMPEPPIWSSGQACISFAGTYDLDLGIPNSDPANSDLFYENVDGLRRYLRGWSSQTARRGVADLTAVPYAQLLNAEYGNQPFNASWHGGELRPGMVFFVRTSEQRYAKVRILRSGQFIRFEWVTYAKKGEGRLPSPIRSGPCSIEETLQCGIGRLPGDTIGGFHVENLSPAEALIQVSATYNPQHGRVLVVPMLLDENGEDISGGYQPTYATPGTSQVKMFSRPGSASSAEVLLYLFEEGRPAEAFACRRFPYQMGWGNR